MKESGGPGLYRALQEYRQSGMYPFHMPGHKRRLSEGPAAEFPNPFAIDITEIEGFDNLHHPEGILRESMEWAARIYGADRTWYLVNGSTAGILAAVCAAVGGSRGSRLLMARNCHKSVYHGVELSGAKAEYLYPRIIEEMGLQGGLLPEEIEKRLAGTEFSAVIVTSPTYDGVVSDIGRIAEICHRHGVALIVDEAHGAHFPFGDRFPGPALKRGADMVVQSLHKTLPSLTQTAVLHVREGLADTEALEHYLQIFQSSSPSYVMLAGIERCIQYMDGPGRRRMEEFSRRLEDVRAELTGMKTLRLLGRETAGRWGVYDIDPSRIVVSAGETGVSGRRLMEILRDRFQLEMEMCGADYVTAITTLMDSPKGLARLSRGFLEIDRALEERREGKRLSDGRKRAGMRGGRFGVNFTGVNFTGAGFAEAGISETEAPEAAMTIGEAVRSLKRTVKIEDSPGCVSGEYVYLYPPGIPIVVPGEVLSEEAVRQICEYRDQGLPIQGLEDYSAESIRVTAI